MVRRDWTPTSMSVVEPASLGSEQAVLGSILIDQQALDQCGELRVDDFSRPDHRLIYSAMVSMRSTGKPIDPILVSDFLQQAGKLDEAGGMPYIATLARETATSANVAAYAGTVIQRAKQRMLMDAGAELTTAARDGLNVVSILDRSRKLADTPAQSFATPVTLADLMAREIPEPRNLIGKLVREASLGLIAAQRGVGKTYFSLAMALAGACGGEFLGHAVETPFHSLFVDGEMTAFDLQQRLKLLSISYEADEEAFERFHILTPDLPGGRMPPIDTSDARVFMAEFLRNNPEVKLVVFDNFACLTRPEAPDTYGARAWMMVNDLLLDCRRAGVSAFVVAHHGKDNDKGVRGASQAEDLLDISIALTEGAIDEIRTNVNVTIKKGRHLSAKDKLPFVASLGPSRGDGLCWTRAGQVPVLDRVRAALLTGMPPGDVANEIGCNRQYVYEIKKKMQDAGELGGGKKTPAQTRRAPGPSIAERQRSRYQDSRDPEF